LTPRTEEREVDVMLERYVALAGSGSRGFFSGIGVLQAEKNKSLSERNGTAACSGILQRHAERKEQKSRTGKFWRWARKPCHNLY